MEVILLEHISKLGHLGDVVSVKDGYARNYLIPQKKALRKTQKNLDLFAAKKQEYEAYNATLKDKAVAQAKALAGFSVLVIRQASENGQLYGSVTARDICLAAQDLGHKIERAQVDVKQAFKNIGIFDVAVVLHPEVIQNIQVVIARSAEDAKSLKNKKEKEAKKTENAEKADKKADEKADETEQQ